MVEKGESLTEAMIREMHEEINFNIEKFPNLQFEHINSQETPSNLQKFINSFRHQLSSLTCLQPKLQLTNSK